MRFPSLTPLLLLCACGRGCFPDRPYEPFLDTWSLVGTYDGEEVPQINTADSATYIAEEGWCLTLQSGGEGLWQKYSYVYSAVDSDASELWNVVDGEDHSVAWTDASGDLLETGETGASERTLDVTLATGAQWSCVLLEAEGELYDNEYHRYLACTDTETEEVYRLFPFYKCRASH